MFKNKAQNLEFLNSYKIDNVEVPKFFIFDVSDWKKNKKKLIEKINKKLNKKICIRSSYYKEDNSKSSLAGKFDSFIDIMNRDNRVSQMLREYVEPYEDGESFHSFSGPVVNCDDYL